MPVTRTDLSDQEKALFTALCQESGITEAALLRRMIRRVLGDRLKEPASLVPKTMIKEGSQVFNLRFDGSEIRAIEKRADEEGFEVRTAWARSVIRQALSGMPALTKREIQIIRESNRELAAIGRYLRAITLDIENTCEITPALFEALTDMLSTHRETVAHFLDLAQNRWAS